jgi:hypothetical protein
MNPPTISQDFNKGLLDVYQQIKIFDQKWDDIEPDLKKEICQLRTQAFGSYTEATFDIDQYDPIYRHIYLFDDEKKKILGYYRMGLTREIRNVGYDQFYTSSLYDIDATFFEKNQNSAEMGRFILDQGASEKQYLMPLLWKSLHKFATKHRLDFYFGMVTLSSDFKDESIRKMAAFMRKNAYDESRAKFFKAKHPLNLNADEINNSESSILALQNTIRGIEGEGGAQVPVMYRTYLSYGDAKYITAGYDPDFGNSLDIIITGHPYTPIVEKIIKKF